MNRFFFSFFQKIEMFTELSKIYIRKFDIELFGLQTLELIVPL